MDKVPARALVSVHALWDELSDFEASETDAALKHALARLSKMIGAQNAFWLGTVRLTGPTARDPVKGWRARALYYLREQPVHRTFAKRAMRNIDKGKPSASEIEHARTAGTFRAARMCDLLGPDWHGTLDFERYRARGVSDALHVIFPVNDGAESYFGFHRKTGRKAFTEADRDLAAYALRGLKWFHRQVMLSRGLTVARQPLTPGERRLQSLLLTELSEPDIAAKLGQSPQTTHKNVTRLLRKLGVNRRIGLTALWLGQAR